MDNKQIHDNFPHLLSLFSIFAVYWLQTVENTRVGAYLQLHIIVLVWGFTGIFGALISPGLDSELIVFYRILIAVTAFLFYAYYSGKRALIKFPEKKEGIKLLLTGAVTALHWITFFHAIRISNVSVALACLSANAFFVSLIEPVFFKRRVQGYEVLLGFLVIAALLLIFNVETNHREGIVLAIFSAFLSAVFGVLNGVFVKRHDPLTISFWEMMGGFLLLVLWFLFGNPSSLIATFPLPLDWLWLVLLGVVCTAWAFLTSVNILKRLSPYTVSVAINLEPVYSIILALIIFGKKEFMSVGFYGGAVLILVTIFADVYLKSANRKQVKNV